MKFRDFLVKNEEKNKEYENLKVTLTEKYSDDPGLYSKVKAEIIRLIEKENE